MPIVLSVSHPEENRPTTKTLPYTAELPCLLRGSFYRFRTCSPSFYAVGKIAKNGWREQFGVAMPNSWQEYIAAQSAPTHFGFRYAGPFFIRCDHGCTHLLQDDGGSTHGTYSICTAASSGSQEAEDFRPGRVFRRSERQLQQAGFAFAWAGIGEEALDTAYGSLVEIGIAHALRKPILLAHHPQANLRDFWFVVETASAVVCAERPISALEMLGNDLAGAAGRLR